MILSNIRFLITQNADREVRENVDIRIEDSTIAAIGPERCAAENERVIDCSEAVVLPGLINAHTHAAMNLLRGISDEKLLNDWLKEDIWPVEDRMDDDDVYLGTKHAICEMLLSGTTCFNDMYLGAPAGQATEESGIRGVIARGLLDVEGNGAERLAESRQLLERYGDHERVHPAVAPHAIYTCSDDLLQEAYKQAEEFDVPYHIHLSETERENADCENAHGMTPTAYLDELGVLSERTVAAHCVHLSETDRKQFRTTGASIVHNPGSNLKLGSGIADVTAMDGLTVALGTDGVASNNNLNLFEEMKLAALGQKLSDPRELSAQQALDMATINGAKALGLDDQIGSIEEGKLADLIIVPLDDITMNPYWGSDGVLSNLVFSFNGAVRDVIVHGELLVRDGELNGMDASDVQQAVQQRVERLQQELAE